MKNRIIKFKAKRLDNSEWVEGDLVHQGLNVYIYNLDENGMLIDTEVDPSTVCQFTGLKDKDEKEIWEHDIITIAKSREPCEVTFWNGCFIAVNSKGIHTTIAKGLDYYSWDLRVIGNKFDRKEGE